ncbi:hypothetical protein DYB37_003280 [Aphanomyces astaci]|uniref:Uncharacterized protein n=1 Tax=Aphanomyces astaci TaxID=112090 RepID=A0A3R7B1H9_APHAT|nr:hypothetical protein DYB35_002488 [Aphanomyces astaci]RHZ06514.1 hypothetical protein DYB37_003280 [Aphanomyces astaci]
MELTEQRIANGNELYKEGRYVDARREYSAAIRELDDAAEASPLVMSRILANRAQTYLQEREYALAFKDADAAVENDPLNVKAHMRRVIACENLEKFDAALKHVRHMLTLSLDSPTLTYALTTQSRLKRNCKSDAAAAKAERYEVGKLVHSQQSLRLNFGSMLPSHLPVGDWIDVVFFVANEFGLFQRGLLPSSVPLTVSIHGFSSTGLNVALEIDSKSLPVEVGVNGKAAARLRIVPSSSVDQASGTLAASRFSLRADLAKGHHVDDVLPHVIELGSGLGLVGLACASLPAVASVVLTDIDDVVPLLEYNVRLNDLSDKASVKPLWWGTSIQHLFNAPYDVVLLSDVVYDPFGYEPLVASLRDLTSPDTTILMGHRSRHPQEKQFFDSLQLEFTLTSIPLDESSAVWAHPSRMADVKLFSIRKKA